jgi:tRNA-specific 2-thiouridylase
MGNRVLVGVSGGVDSGVTAHLLKERGFEVVGLYLKMHRGVDHSANLRKVEVLAKKLGFNFYIEDVQAQFEEEVYNYFIESYRQGATPNPCAMCNTKIKFGLFTQFLEKYHADYGATGHYVRSDGQFLYKGRDRQKDQSYFLFGIQRELLPRLLFPLGEFLKEEVKKLAAEIGLPELASQRESQDICFIPGSYIDLLRLHFNPDRPGGVYNRAGQKIGTHKGYPHYTIGQRKGFRLFKSRKPHYVIGIDPVRNRLIVGEKSELYRRTIFLKGVNLFIEEREFPAQVKVRYRAPEVPGVVKMESRTKGVVHLTEPASGVAKGQACVFYDGDRLLGGGWIRGAK